MPQCKSRSGVYDLSGTFAEWTGSMPEGKDNRRYVKGGQRHNPRRGTRCTFTTDESVAFKDGSMSFRCCMNPKAE